MKYLAVVNENGWNDSRKIIERLQEKYGNITIAELLDKMEKEVVILN